jgi:muskelin
MPDAGSSVTTTLKRRHAVLLLAEDPEEIALRDSSTKPLSAERFKQRTEVFEGLLRFFGEDGKQPMGSRLDMVDAEDGILGVMLYSVFHSYRVFFMVSLLVSSL